MTTTHAEAGPFVSLVVATLGSGTDILGDLLASLTEQQDAPPFEVIIVDQNGDDRFDELVARYRPALAITHEKVPFRGASRARNHGAQMARGRWLGFPDDDCKLRPYALARMRAAAEATGMRIITGRTVDETGAVNVLRFGDVAERFSRWTMFRCVTECTLFVEKDLYAAVQGFDPRFGPGGPYPAAEGIDLVNRLLGETPRGYFSPEIEFIHPTKIPPWTAWAVDRFGRYAVGDGALIAKSLSLPMLYWGGRTVLSAIVNIVTHDGHRRAAYAARLGGLCKGLVGYRRPRVP